MAAERCSSSTAKSGPMPARWLNSRRKAAQKLWMVPIWVRRTRALWRRSRLLPGFRARAAASSWVMRLRSSPAAARV